MRKTTVYLTDDEAEALRRLSSETGRSQADLIREGLRSIIEPLPRRFHSMASGSRDGRHPSGWDHGELYDKVMGRR